MRLIDADGMIAKWRAAMLHMVKAEDGMHPISMEVLIEDLKDAPTIEAEPVKHGEWVITEGRPTIFNECSLCNDRWSYGVAIHMNYCPNCGAKMGGGGGGAD